jgi:hypothetical protein
MEVMLLVWKVERFVIQDVKQAKLLILEKDIIEVITVVVQRNFLGESISAKTADIII